MTLFQTDDLFNLKWKVHNEKSTLHWHMGNRFLKIWLDH